MTEGKRKKSSKKSSKKKKKGGNKKIPWYMQEELIREQQERERQEREAEEARLKMEEEQRWFESLSPAEKEKVEVKKSSETRRAFWQQFYENKNEEDDLRKRREEEIRVMREKRAEEKQQRTRLAQQGALELDYGHVVMEKCNTCAKTVYEHEKILVGNKVFHKLGCFKCFFCNTPLKLWNYKILEGRFYCSPHYEQFKQKILAKKTQENQKKALEEEKKKEELQRQEEERLQREKEEEERAKADAKKKEEELAAEIQARRDELARQAEEMRKMLEAEENGTPLEIPAPTSVPAPAPVPETSVIPAVAIILPDESGEVEKAKKAERKALLQRAMSRGHLALLVAEGDADETDTSDTSEEEEEEDEEESEGERDSQLGKLLELAQAGDKAGVEDLLSKNVVSLEAANSKGETVLHAAVLSSNLELVRFLIEKGANVTALTKSKDTPLHVICNSALSTDAEKLKADEEIVKLLVSQPNALIDLPDGNNNTPIILASSRGRAETVRTLIHNKADVRPKNNIGATCLHAAADGGQVEVAKQLMNAQQMDVDIEDDQGYTPLHLAVMANHLNMTKLLLALGANQNAKDKFHGRTPLDEAKTPELKQLFHLFAHKKPAAVPATTSPSSLVPPLSIGNLGLPVSDGAPLQPGEKSPRSKSRILKGSAEHGGRTPRAIMNRLFGTKEEKTDSSSSPSSPASSSPSSSTSSTTEKVSPSPSRKTGGWFGRKKVDEDKSKKATPGKTVRQRDSILVSSVPVPHGPSDAHEMKEDAEETKKRLQDTKEFWRTVSANSLKNQEIQQGTKKGSSGSTLKKKGDTKLPAGFKKKSTTSSKEKAKEKEKEKEKEKGSTLKKKDDDDEEASSNIRFAEPAKAKEAEKPKEEEKEKEEKEEKEKEEKEEKETVTSE